ncbi:MAG: amino acid ABC transporter substrate-binding protein [Moraxellaceae bacterium]|nr:amino acid ABC transporter substrate-binding protein [Moraxellaceae bacterium]
MKKILTLAMVTILALIACSSDKNINTNVEGMTYKVGMDLDYPPYEFIGEQGKPTGFEVELLQAIANDQKVKVTFVPMPWNLLLQGLNKNEYDMVIGGFGEDDLELDSNDDIDYRLPKAHLYTQDVLATLAKNQADLPKKLKGLKNYKVTTLENSAWAEDLQDITNKENIIEKKSSFLSLQALMQGKAEFILTDKGVIKYYQKTIPQSPLVTKDDYFKPYEVFAVINEDKKELVKIFNKGLTNVVESGQYTRIYKKWFGEEPIKMPSV